LSRPINSSGNQSYQVEITTGEKPCTPDQLTHDDASGALVIEAAPRITNTQATATATALQFGSLLYERHL
jgi:hypothetical protein